MPSYILQPVNRGCIFMVYLTLWRFCFLSINTVQMTLDDPDSKDNVRSVCLSSSSSLLMWQCLIYLVRHLWTTQSVTASWIKYLVLIGNALICYIAQFLDIHRLHPFQFLWFVLYLTLYRRPMLFECLQCEVNAMSFALEETGMTTFFKYLTKWKSDDRSWD